MEPAEPHLSRRERQIMDVIYRLGEATAAEVQQHLPGSPSYSAVRALLRVLETKGHLRHEERGPRFVYRPIVPRDHARHSALQRLVDIFFQGSTEEAVAALIDMSVPRLSAAERKRIGKLIEKANKEGR